MIKQTKKLALSKCRVESVPASRECHRLVAENKGCELDETENGQNEKKKNKQRRKDWGRGGSSYARSLQFCSIPCCAVLAKFVQKDWVIHKGTKTNFEPPKC